MIISDIHINYFINSNHLNIYYYFNIYIRAKNPGTLICRKL